MVSVDENQITTENKLAAEPAPITEPWITVDRLIVLGLTAVSIMAGLVIWFVPEMFGWALIALPVVSIVGFVIVRNPFVGAVAFLTYSTLRPYDFLPFLIPLRLSMVMEVLTLAAWVVSLAINKQRIKWSPVHTMFAIFLLPIGLGMVTAMNRYYPFVTLQAIMVYFLMFVIITNVADSMKRVKLIAWMFMLVHAYFAVKGTFTFVTGGYSDVSGYTSGAVGSGPLADENDFALALNMMIPFAFFGFQFLEGKTRYVCAGLLVLFAMGVVASFSRGGMVGLAAVVVFGIASSQRKLAATGVAGLLVVTMLLFASDRYWKEAESITDSGESTAYARLTYWNAGLRMFVDSPLIGVGADNGKLQMPNYYDGVGDPNSQWGRTFHGTWPQILAELGLAGAIPNALMLFFSLKYLWRIRRQSRDDVDPAGRFLANSMIGSLIAYQACGTFLSTAYYPQTYYMYSLIMAFVFCYKPTPADSDRTSTASPETATLTLPETSRGI